MTYPPAPPGYRPAPPPPLSPGGQPLADFSTRLLAYMIDGAIVTAVMFVLFVPVTIWYFLRITSIEYIPDGSAFVGEVIWPFLLLELAVIVFLLAAYYVYYVEMMYRSGQTVGKKAMKIRVVPMDPQQRLTRGTAAKRYAVEMVGGTLVPFFALVDGLWQLNDKPYQQTLHDKAAQTVVIKVSQ